MNKNSFILYTSDYEPVKSLSLEEKGMLLDAIFEYAIFGTVKELPPVISMSFSYFRIHIDSNTKKYKEICEKRREAGRKGGETKQANVANATNAKQNKQKLANVADNDNVNDNDINNNIGESTDSPTALSFENIWTLYGKKGNKKTSERKWSKLSAMAKEKAFSYIPAYVESTPDKQYRKNLETFLNQEVWNDELSSSNNVNQQTNETKYKFID